MRHYSAVILAVPLHAALTAAPNPNPTGRDLLPSELPGSTLPVVQAHSCTMSGRVRALLLWVGRDDVGSGVIRWRAEGDRNGYELLIGSDPLRAPGNLNKWGYLAEEVRAGECDVVGVISQSAEEGLRDVKAGLAGPAARRPFNTIRGRIGSHQAFARVATVQASSSVTYREAAAVLALTLGTG